MEWAQVIIISKTNSITLKDRGGSTVLINLIKKTKVPIICIANDRQHPKMRTLANHCLDIKFAKPMKATVSKRLA